MTLHAHNVLFPAIR